MPSTSGKRLPRPFCLPTLALASPPLLLPASPSLRAAADRLGSPPVSMAVAVVRAPEAVAAAAATAAVAVAAAAAARPAGADARAAAISWGRTWEEARPVAQSCRRRCSTMRAAAFRRTSFSSLTGRKRPAGGTRYTSAWTQSVSVSEQRVVGNLWVPRRFGLQRVMTGLTSI